MSIIEQIKAEIDKRYAEYLEKMKTYDFTYYEGMADALDLFEQFIDTLESEKPMNQEGLEEEIQRFLSNATKMDKGEWKGKYPISEMGFGVVARHFAQWGAGHLAGADKTSPKDLAEEQYNLLTKACDARYEQAKKDTLERVCEWLEENATYIHPRTGKETCVINLNVLREAMEDE